MNVSFAAVGRMFFRKIGLILASIWMLAPLQGQKALLLKIGSEDREVFWETVKTSKMRPLEYPSDTARFAGLSPGGVDSICLELLRVFREKSFLAVSIDSLRITNDSLATALLRLGPPMRWISLRNSGTESELWVNAAGYREKIFSQRPFNHDELLKLQTGILERAENNGYPFARVWLDSVEIRADGGVSAVLKVERKRFFSFKGLKMNGDVHLPRYFLPNYLGLQPGMPYSRERVLRVREQLQSLPFLESSSNPSVSFAGSEATVNLFLQKKRASRFDFIVGILPQPDNPGGKLLLTGSLSAAFQNALGLGERFSIELERLRPQTQKLDVQTGVPYLFGTPFGADGRLGIFKRDSTWVDAQGEAGVQYLFAGGNYLRLLWENRSASLQTIDTATIVATHRLPANLDLKQNGFGVESSFSRLDYRFNPRKGWALSIKTVAGFNRVQRNSQIEALHDADSPDFRFSSLYDSVTQRDARLRLEGQGALYIPVFTRSTIKLNVRAGGIFANNPVIANEQYRLGGNKLLRGFDEESLQATRFVVTTAEWRLLIGQNSFLAAFADWAYLENLTERSSSFLHPLGFGAGLNFETRAGIFGINVAVGRRDPGQAVNFRAAKFHLGYVSLF